jgi:hypothetical protein
MENIPYLNDLLQFMEAHDELIIWSSSISLILFVGTLVSIPIIIVKLPSDYFVRDKNLARRYCQDKPLLGIIIIGLKNIFGIIFLLMGFLMLFIPGQGVLTMLIGYSMLDFLNKRKLIYKIARRPSVYNFINKTRKKYNKDPIQLKNNM